MVYMYSINYKILKNKYNLNTIFGAYQTVALAGKTGIHRHNWYFIDESER